MRRKLTVTIPTYNRSPYLAALLENIASEFSRDSELQKSIGILISDNCSTDDTEAVCRRFEAEYPESFVYHRNATNIGMCRNFLECVKRAGSEYVWIFGDDEILLEGGLSLALEAVATEADILYLGSEPDALFETEPRTFTTYKSYVDYIKKVNPSLVLGSTLLTRCIFRSSVFDMELGEASIPTHYAHTYALTLDPTRSVALYPGKIFQVREARPEFAEPIVNEVHYQQNVYMWRMGRIYGAPSFMKYALCEQVKYFRRKIKSRLGLYKN